MKKLIFTILAMTISSITLAGPFGLSMGMKKSQFKELNPTGNMFVYDTKTVPIPSSIFESYALHIGDRNGLSVITAFTEVISSNRYGFSLKERFNSLKGALEKKYGKHRLEDLLLSGSIWDKPEDFMIGLSKNERYLRAYWNNEEKSNLSDDLKSIVLIAAAIDSERGMVYVHYEFTNSEAFHAEREAIDSEAL